MKDDSRKRHKVNWRVVRVDEKRLQKKSKYAFLFTAFSQSLPASLKSTRQLFCLIR